MLILKYLLERQGTPGTLSQDGGAGERPPSTWPVRVSHRDAAFSCGLADRGVPCPQHSLAASLKLVGILYTGMPFDFLALGATRDLHAWAPRDCNNQKDGPWLAITPRELTAQTAD